MSPRATGSVLSAPALIGRRAKEEGAFLKACVRSGLLRMNSPATAKAGLHAYRTRGPLGAIMALSVTRDPGAIAFIDERGETTFGQFEERTNALANAWSAAGVNAGDGVGLMMRNHAGVLEALFACVKLGAKAIFMNTSFSGPQLASVSEREGVQVLVYDEEFEDVVKQVSAPSGRYRAWTTTEGDDADDTIHGLVSRGDTTPPPSPSRHASLIILTSGTTGTPKGAARQQPKSLAPFGGPLSVLPFKGGETTVLPTPMFHSIGLLHSLIAVGLGNTLILRHRFDAAQTLKDVEEHKATGLIVVPVMLRRILDEHDKQGRKHDLSSLRIVFAGGSQLGGTLATRAMDTIGDVVYNLYGSTEVAIATIATPEDLRKAPDSVGQVVTGSRVRILDDEGRDVPHGTTGRIFVGTAMPFEGYTGGGTKDLIDGLMSSGDVGHFDDDDLLTIDGRDDDMIVSGGENVFPAELEELLAAHDAVSEAAVLGVDDEEFGQRLKAFVVLESGQDLSEDDVKAYAKDNLARYKVPREVVFLDELPRNPTGKVLKRDLK
ncbi:acyl-CoA synthetase [Patulibacter sp.]|uniref:acyl-CoA synthetase n=1 Tax=Patulibacter sp. TaxID=1912859 RepID=UPI002719EA09|nr:acyl-CoA synthetase [Patulibacter sp.]MDO9410386.1 acyl-CoA synthetase [Patulibacter sp.]